MSGFFSFNLDYESQERPNWCWSACFSWIIRKFNTTEEGYNQWQILRFYCKTINANLESSKSKSEIETESIFNLMINTISERPKNEVGILIDLLLNWSYEEIDVLNFGDEKYEELEYFFNYDTISDLLFKNKAPIIVATANHMVLISGFGRDECGDYILISDPDSNNAEYFILIKDFYKSIRNDLVKLWVLINESDYVLEHDKFINKAKKTNIELRNMNLGSNINQIHSDDLFLQKISYRINSTLLNFEGDSYVKLNSLVNQTITSALVNPFCERIIPRYEMDTTRFIELIKAFIANNRELSNLDFFEIYNPRNINSLRFKPVNENGVLKGEFENKIIDYRIAISNINNQ